MCGQMLTLFCFLAPTEGLYAIVRHYKSGGTPVSCQSLRITTVVSMKLQDHAMPSDNMHYSATMFYVQFFRKFEFHFQNFKRREEGTIKGGSFAREWWPPMQNMEVRC